MKSLRFLALGAAALLLSAAGAAAQTVFLNFDSVASGTAASTFNTSFYSFHNAMWAPSTDEFGDAIPGSEHWQVDAASDASYPLTVDTITDWETSAPYTDGNALNGQAQAIIVLFDKAYNLSNFSVTLDTDPYGFNWTVDFVSGSTITAQVAVDQSVPGYVATLGSVGNITGFVLPSSGYYDNLSFTATAVPEPSTWAAIAGAASLGLVLLHRRSQARAAQV